MKIYQLEMSVNIVDCMLVDDWLQLCSMAISPVSVL
ncbi:Uncharacterised protein [Serratia rubidaea]|uniref:Uncharacterized protein n=1 Tax=Serratia rubidaea TaxID=61652 RepID=A0A3S4JUK4_SERRU|nr:Uncharacterised protein [Serratia rubidaea]